MKEKIIDKHTRLVFSNVDDTKYINVPYYDEHHTSNDNYVSFGIDNTFPNQLYGLVLQSPTANSIVTGSIEYIKALPKTSQYLDELTYNELRSACIQDYIIFGEFFIQLLKNSVGQIVDLIHIPAEMCRMNEDRSRIWVNKRWAKYATNSVQYKSFEASLKEEEQDPLESLIYVYSNGGNRSVYGKGLFISALNDIASEASASQYIKNSLDSGLASRFIIDLPNSANLTDDDKEDIERAITDKFCGASNAGKFMLYFNSGDKDLNVSTIDNDDSHERFNAIREAAKNNIFIAAHATPNLFGDPTQTTGFNDQEYESALKLYKMMVINPSIEIFDRSINYIFENKH